MTINPASSSSQPCIQKQVLSFTPCQTSTNGPVVSKQAPEAFLPVKKKSKKQITKEPEEVPDSKTECKSLRADLENEDNTLERQEAISSPVKKTEFQAAAKVNAIHFNYLKYVQFPLQSLIKSKKHKPKLMDLPPGANNNNIFAKIVFPNFIGLFLLVKSVLTYTLILVLILPRSVGMLMVAG